MLKVTIDDAVKMKPGVMEMGLADLFAERHICNKSLFWRRVKKAVVVTQEEPNGIGPAYTATCACGAQMDVTDYEAW
jgi:hypothetical protein